MKHVAILLTLFFSICDSAFAQTDGIKKWKIGSVGLRAQAFSNDYGDQLSYTDIQKMLKDPNSIGIDMEGYEKADYFYAELSGGMLGIQVSLNRQLSERASNSITIYSDFHVGSELLLDYQKKGSNSQETEYLGWCLLRDRLDIGASYDFNYHINRFTISFGPSITLGKSFNDKLLLLNNETSDEALHTANARSYTVVYGHLGGGVSYRLFKRISISYALKYGLGYEVGQRGSLNYQTGDALVSGFVLSYLF